MLITELINSLFDTALPEASHWESHYPPRDLPAGAIVTRFGPSPTGFLHTGGVYVATLGKNLAHHSGGSYFIRIEDTDQATYQLARRIFANERQPGVMQRKDLAKWGEFRVAYGLYFEELFPRVTESGTFLSSSKPRGGGGIKTCPSTHLRRRVA